MTTEALAIHTAQAGGQHKDSFSQNALSSPSAASSTSDSVFSNGDARSSQSSAPSSVKGSPLTYENLSDHVSSDSVNDQLGQDFSQASLNGDATRPTVSACQRRHPRRTSHKHDHPYLQHESAKHVPALVRQCDRKELFVEALVDTATEMIEVIWPRSKTSCSLPQSGRHILDLRKFVQEVLRRSKTSHSTLQVALFYLMLLIPFVPKPDAPERASDSSQCRALRCGRRMFLAALILGSKYLQDRNYTMSAWAKISGLKKEEICFNELAFLKTVNFDLHVPEAKYKIWTELVFKCSVDDDCRILRAMNGGRCEKWRAIIPHLTADLANTGFAEAKASELSPVSPTSTPSLTSAASSRWSPPASPYDTASDRSDSPLSIVNVPPPQFLEPKVMTPADYVRFPTSPKLSKLETPCLPPINFDCSPAARRNQTTPTPWRSGSMSAVMKQTPNILADRRFVELPRCSLPPRVKSRGCSRRSGLSKCSSSSSESDFSQDENDAAPTPTARESYLRASRAVDVVSTAESDRAAECAAQSLLTLRNLDSASAYPTPVSMDNYSFSSACSEEVRTPKLDDPAGRPVARTAQKRARSLSKWEYEVPCGGAFLDAPTVQSPSSMLLDSEPLCTQPGLLEHRNGIFVDYGAGVDVVRSRASHVRSASGSRNGARKKPCSSGLANCIRA